MSKSNKNNSFMSEIRIKYFGPIKEGLANGAFLEVKKVTLFIGNQASGKSSIAKLFSTCTWLEKNLTRGLTKENYFKNYNRFKTEFCAYQGIEDYFTKKTEIEYIGDAYRLHYQNEKLTINSLETKNNYLSPKVMYVPAERNFLSIVPNPESVEKLPAPLHTFLTVFNSAKQALRQALSLPINQLQFEYQKQHKISYIKAEDGFKLRLHNASSGIQSLVPLYLVSHYLANFIDQKENKSIKQNSVEEAEIKNKKLLAILLNDETINIGTALNLLSKLYKNHHFINIVEELEQNLYPSSQQNLLYALLELNNITLENKLLLTTHSPYLINYLTLAIKANQLLDKINQSDKKDDFKTKIKAKLTKIVPLESCITAEEVRIYELSNKGTIQLLGNYEGLPSDNNYLNQFLANTNELFDDLLDIEDELL